MGGNKKVVVIDQEGNGRGQCVSVDDPLPLAYKC